MILTLILCIQEVGWSSFSLLKMPVYEDSRYASATEILEVTLEQVTGKETDPVKYLSDDR